jgi:ActR/RegA family two-component response regulator
MTLNSTATSCSSSEEVGSSMMTRRAKSRWPARWRPSAAWRWKIHQRAHVDVEVEAAEQALGLRMHRRPVQKAIAAFLGAPMQMFSATLRSGTRLIS